ncbi:SRPBCC family protein [Burkholderia aenigmatica]|uniref:SRPBCC family protein n=1 Tax=Burkholderia cepacia complex TaxID=87882 RepID=UPI001C238222|nr:MULTISPECIES: SRPBCC family protein [Burkholderia cepacia complex]HDR8923045.1 SRPBCC family protein [Burkholderia vietnamiensis]MBU9445233.1 SRPBCC family protein [Burkholderia multivorans]MCA8222095.1 SRPBCC family protein [Burkholderia multivorans]UKD17549.1 SRPBCC family protein [Burkholderia aenigmatica]HDR8980667.1 SRPBCC family protein [Burkholderia vietnamiensis]
MNFQYQFELGVPVDEAWAVLMDVPNVAPCLPGAAIESGENGDYVGRVKVKLGPIEMTYRGDVKFVERDDAAQHAVINVAAKEVKGGGAAKAVLTLDVAPAGSGARVSVGSEFTVSGKAAQFGRGVMDEVGEKLMGEFAVRLSKLISTAKQASTVAAAPTGGSPAVEPRQTTAVVQNTPVNTSEGIPVQAVAQSTRQPAGASANSASSEDDVLDVMAAAKGAVMRRVVKVVAVLAVLATASTIAFHWY